MPILRNLDALLELGASRDRPEHPGLLGLDVSKRAIGVAGADAGWRLATPLITIRRSSWARDLGRLRAVVDERQARALVLGWPLNMDGSEGPRCRSVRAFAENLDAAMELPMLLFDERLTTFAAEEIAERLGLSASKRTQMLDALAAATILQDALDALARRSGRGPRPEGGVSRPV